MKYFWDRIETLLGNRSESWLARSVGVSRSTYSTWKVNGRLPKGDKVLLLASTLGVTVEELLRPVSDGPNTREPIPSQELANFAVRHPELVYHLTALERVAPESLSEIQRYLAFQLAEKSETKS